MKPAFWITMMIALGAVVFSVVSCGRVANELNGERAREACDTFCGAAGGDVVEIRAEVTHGLTGTANNGTATCICVVGEDAE